MIKSVKLFSIIYTNHNTLRKIVKSRLLKTLSIDKLNLRFVKVFKYVQRFNLIIRHKFDKFYTISNALSRLSNESISLNNNNIDDELDILFARSIIEINFDFKKRLQYDYILNLN